MTFAIPSHVPTGNVSPARPAIPHLWVRARAFLASMFATHGAPQTHLRRGAITPADRNAIMKWLKPAERLVRGLLIIDAITHLLMTQQGRRQRATARPITLPEPLPPPPPPQPPRRPFFIDTGIDLYATIAQHYVYKPKKPQRAVAPVDPNDPATWRAPFRVLSWIDTGAPRKPPPRRAAPSVTPRSHLRLIRRIEALRRVLEDPVQRTRRLAAYIARLPKGCLGAAPPTVCHRGKPLAELREDLLAMTEHIETAIESINSS